MPRPLGATCGARGVNFAIFSSHATRIELALFDAAGGAEMQRFDLPGRSGDVWHGFLPAPRAGPGTRYAFYVHGPNDPHNGHRFDPTTALLDPYARRLTVGTPLRSSIVDGIFDWADDCPPAVPWRDTVIYELHMRGFTRLHPGVPQAWRGKYLGLTVRPVVDHLTSLGVTTVELLPCQSFLSELFLRARGQSNYWGYNSVAWFAPANEYAVDDAVVEFKTMVKALHAAKIEVILDVVFNHTAEGNESGPVLNLKGIDNSVYYRLMPDKSLYQNDTGCGNTVNCEHPQVRALIIDCLKYWVEDMHVDGFRFDLATVLARDGKGFNEHSPFFKAVRAEASLERVKLIAEPWDVGWGGYQLGRFPAGWAEWNDRYRDTVRSFWRRDAGRIGELAERFAGSSDLLQHNGRKPTANINFVTAHDGFTLHDLVAYNDRHNEANLEQNTDGASNNLSWNCGVEGATADEAVLALRKRQMRNLLATLVLSQGVPMLQAGDEFGRTQGGNNNAFCQDNEISWIDWRLRDLNYDLCQFVRLLTKLRRDHAELRRETFLKGSASRTGFKDVSWLHMRGGEMTYDDWHDRNLRTMGILLANRSSTAHRLLILLNAGDQGAEFSVPAADPGAPWVCRFDTAREHADIRAVDFSHRYPMVASSAVLLEC
ncbi:MAG: glycogen debranching protein GlgX [Steroidobacteraceae bacterium]